MNYKKAQEEQSTRENPAEEINTLEEECTDVDQQMSNDTTETEDSPNQLQLQVELLTKELEVAKEKSIRAQAEIENIRRRSANEQMNARKFAIEGFAGELLAVKDSLDLASQVEISADNKLVIENMREGLSLTLKQLDSAFDKFSIEQILPEKGDRLDPQIHQAMTIQDTDEVDNNCILVVIQKGYSLHNRLLRPAMVVIARKPEEKITESDEKKA